ncbi:4710_t:CDS:2, partial [Acaulospora morrowiae]
MATEEASRDPATSTSKRNTDLEALSLNYLRSQDISVVPDDNNIQKLQPCKLCNKAILGFNLEAFTVLDCGHLFHRICLEKHIIRGATKYPTCPTCNTDIEIFREETALASGECAVLPAEKGEASQQSNVTIVDDGDGDLEEMIRLGLIGKDELSEKTKQVTKEDRGTSPANVHITPSTVQVRSEDQTPIDANVDNSSKSIQNQLTSTSENMLPGNDSLSRDTIKRILPSKRTDVPEEDISNKKQKILDDSWM